VTGETVEVPVDDLRLVCDCLGSQPYDRSMDAASKALSRLVDLLPNEWHPSVVMQLRYCQTMHPGYPAPSHVERCEATDSLKRLHAAGLLRDDL
jgi:hypothetical protein